MAQSTSTYSDFNNSFTQNPITNDLGRITNQNAIRQSLINLINTDKYERLLNPLIGSNIRRALFEPANGRTTVILQSAIKETIDNFEPRVNLLDVICAPFPDQNGYQVNIKYSITMSSAIQNLSFPLVRAR